MKQSSLEAAINRKPFKPFEIRIDGEVIPVLHPEQALFAEGKTTLVLVDPDDHLHIMDVASISKLRVLPRKSHQNGTSRKSS